MIFAGTAGWSIPRAQADAFATAGTHLQRYARVLPCAEINSSFYRNHRVEVYAKWAAATPASFRFSVKLPQTITHESGLRRARRPLEQFLEQTAGLGKKRGPLLVQLPGSLEFDTRSVRSFFKLMRSMHPGAIVCEPRHASWFAAKAETVLLEHHIGRVAADPARVPGAQQPGGWMMRDGATRATIYHRWHGSPRTYWSRYPMDRIRQWSAEIAALPVSCDVWCIFDNTASGSALPNACELLTCVPPRCKRK